MNKSAGQSALPDLPGCIATGHGVAEVQQSIRKAIELHLSGMRENGIPVPPPSSQVDYIDVATYAAANGEPSQEVIGIKRALFEAPTDGEDWRSEARAARVAQRHMAKEENAMRMIVAILSTVLLLGCQTMPAPDTAKAEIAAVTQKWIDGMTRHDVDGVVALYDPEAVLWGTRSPTLRDKPDKVLEYFKVLRTVPPSYKAVLGEQRIRVHGDIAINTGTYTFSEMRDGKEVVRPARFSFVYRYQNGRWLIIDHHSSAVPAQT